MVGNGALSNIIDCIVIFLEILNVKRHQNCIPIKALNLESALDFTSKNF